MSVPQAGFRPNQKLIYTDVKYKKMLDASRRTLFSIAKYAE